MELLNMDNLKESNQNFIKNYLDEYGDIGRANRLIEFFNRPDFPKDYGTLILDGWLDEMNSIMWGD